jgi:hypothetical protein
MSVRRNILSADNGPWDETARRRLTALLIGVILLSTG